MKVHHYQVVLFNDCGDALDRESFDRAEPVDMYELSAKFKEIIRSKDWVLTPGDTISIEEFE